MIGKAKELMAAAMAVASIGCGPQMEAADDRTAQEAGGSSGEAPTRAVAVLRPTGGAEATGQVLFVARGSDSVHVSTRTEGLAPGRHAHHVHEYGDCRAQDGSSAGEHLPFQDVSERTEPDVITGNLGDVVMPGTGGEAGAATSESVIDLSGIGGLEGIVGRSVVVHRFENDPSQPPGGDAGPRVACGVIGVVER